MKNFTKAISILLSVALLLFLGGDFTNLRVLDQQELPNEINGNRTFKGHLSLGEKIISPGNSPGLITVNGNLSFGNNALYKAELKDITGPGVGHDQIVVTGDVSLNGTLNVVLDGYIPDVNHQFEILSFGGSLNGSFTNINWPPSMLTWDIDYGILFPNKVTLYSPEGVLPVVLLNFEGQIKNGEHLLTWQTASEVNNDYFNIEHSNNTQVFTSLHTVYSNGNSTSIQNYAFTHSKPLKGENYYRLKQVDKNGKVSYSNIISLFSGQTESIDFYPNPANNTLYFSSPVESVTICDLFGRKIMELENVGSILDTSSLSPGVYSIVINQGKSVQKLTISH